MENQKYLFLFQNVIEHSFLPQKDRMDIERMVVGPKQCFNVLTQKYRITVPKVSEDFVYTFPLLFLKTFSSHVLTSKSLIWVKMITLVFFWTLNEILVWIWSLTLSLHFGKPKVPIFLSKCTQHSFLPKKDRMDIERIVFEPKHSALMFWHKNILLQF